MKNIRPTALVALLALSIGSACPGADGGGGGGEGEGEAGDCVGDVDTADVDAFFASIACTWNLTAEDRQFEGTTDTRFTHGTTYAVVISADKVVTLPGADGDIVFDYTALSGSYADEDNEANVFINDGDNHMIVQWDKGASTLQIVFSNSVAQFNWSFTASGPPSPFIDSETEFMAGTWQGKVTEAFRADLTTPSAALCASVSVTVDASGNAVLTFDGDEVTFAYTPRGAHINEFGSGPDDVFELNFGDTFDPDLGLEWRRATGSSDVPALSRIEVRRAEESTTATYAVAIADQADCT